MEEVTRKAIPIRRSRSTARSAPVGAQGWTEGMAAGVRLALAPPRQVWLASLGATAVTVRGARALWEQLLAEGAQTQARLRSLLSSLRS